MYFHQVMFSKISIMGFFFTMQATLVYWLLSLDLEEAVLNILLIN